MPERGKCQACGIYANMETVRVSVKGYTVLEAALCRRCACDVEDMVVKWWNETRKAAERARN